MPRMMYCEFPTPVVAYAKPGTLSATCEKSWTFSLSSASLEIVLMLAGTSCNLSLRFSAVTTTSSRVCVAGTTCGATDCCWALARLQRSNPSAIAPAPIRNAMLRRLLGMAAAAEPKALADSADAGAGALVVGATRILFSNDQKTHLAESLLPDLPTLSVAPVYDRRTSSLLPILLSEHLRCRASQDVLVVPFGRTCGRHLSS